MIDPLHRRDFLRLLAVATAALAGCHGSDPSPPGAETGGAACQEEDQWGALPTGEATDLPHLGGAPDTEEGRAIAAFCDTILPGRHRDETGAPGAIDVGVPAAFFDPTLPAAALVGLLVALLNGQAAAVVEGATFAGLGPEDRELAVEGALTLLAEMEFAVQLVRLAYYSSAGAGCWLGYPGPNPGYYDDPELSFLDPMAEELTVDGNLP